MVKETIVRKLKDKAWNAKCGGIYVPVTYNSDMCYKGKCLKGETDDNKACSHTNRCKDLVDKPSDIPLKYRYSKDNQCYDIRFLFEYFENKLNSYNYRTLPVYPEGIVREQYSVNELRTMASKIGEKNVQMDYPILNEFLKFSNSIIEDFRIHNEQILSNKYGNPHFKNIFTNYLRAIGYRYIGSENNRIEDITDRPYGQQADQIGWVNYKYVIKNKYPVYGVIGDTKNHMLYMLNSQKDLFKNTKLWDYVNKSNIISDRDLNVEELLEMHNIRELEKYKRINRNDYTLRNEKIVSLGTISTYNSLYNRFSSKSYNQKGFNETLLYNSPKLIKLLENIKDLDKKDINESGKLFKHFIFSRNADSVISALISDGFKHPFETKINNRNNVSLNINKRNFSSKTFGIMANVKFPYLQDGEREMKPLSIALSKKIQTEYNSRPSNINGNNLRIMVLDHNFQEGVDLFDVKYVHMIEEPLTKQDGKQSIGRALRRCGQLGLNFVNNKGWEVEVYNYISKINETSVNDMALLFGNMPLNMKETVNQISNILSSSSVDYYLNTNGISIPEISVGLRQANLSLEMDPIDYQKKISNIYRNLKIILPTNIMNDCNRRTSIIDFTNPQKFVLEYFKPKSKLKGILLNHAIGSGKTCSAVAVASYNFDYSLRESGSDPYTIMWVTRGKLKEEMWKNTLDLICHKGMQERVREGLPINKRNLKRNWIRPITYEQFINIFISIYLNKPNKLAKELIKRNGSVDPLKRTLIILDESHKIYDNTLPITELSRNFKICEEYIHNSYDKSDNNSCRVLLLSGTPIKDNDFSVFISLINLISKKVMPIDYNLFANEYLDETGKFTLVGENKFRKMLQGKVLTYDPINNKNIFAQPVFTNIIIPLSKLTTHSDCVIIKKDNDNRCKIIKDNKIINCIDRFNIENERCLELPSSRECIRNSKKNLSDCKKSARDDEKNCKENNNVYKSCKLKVYKIKGLKKKYILKDPVVEIINAGLEV